MKASQHRKFDQGMNQDVDSVLLPEGYVYYAKNFIFDQLGIARKRGGISGVGATTNYRADLIGALVSDTGATTIMAAGTDDVKFINTTTGAMTNLGLTGGYSPLPNPDGGRPFQHYGFLIWPYFNNNNSDITPVAAAGATGSVAARTFTTPGSIVVTAGDRRITCAAADSPTTLMQVGQIVVVRNVAGNIYIGRVTNLVSTTAFEVYPTPTLSITGSAAFTANALDPFVGGGYGTGIGSGAFVCGKVGCSYQGRIVLGNIGRVTNTPLRQELYPRRVWFSSTLLEGDAFGANAVTGAVFLTNNAFPALNYFDIPVQEAITALSPTGFGDLLIFSAARTFRMTGNLSTQYGTEQSITWSPREIPNSVGCMSERSLQRTPRGVIFAHDSGIYSTDGNSMQPLMYQRMQDYWKALVGPSSGTFTILGSALIRGNHYYVCGTSGSAYWALMVNLDTLAWTTIQGAAAPPAAWLINSSVQDPGQPSRVWGLKYQGLTGATSMTGGQLLKLDQMFQPSSANRADSDGLTVQSELITPPYAEGSQTLQKTWLDATIEYAQQGSNTFGVSPAFVIDSADAPSAAQFLTTLDPQDALTVTGATNAIPVVVTVSATHSIKVDTWVRVRNVSGNTGANGLFRVQAVTGTTITLMGSIGEAAYISGGTVQAVDQRDISLLNTERGTLLKNFAAVAYRFTDGGADFIEIRGITHTWEERDQPSE